MDRKSKNELFLTACDYLFSEKFVTSQKDLSAKIGITPASFSRIKSGLMGVSDETIRRMNEAFGNIFDMRYFRGQSDHFLHSSLINAMLAAKDETIAELRARIADKDSQLADKDSQLADKETIITAQQSQLADKEALILSQQSIIAELSAKLSPRYDVVPSNTLIAAESTTKLQKQ